MSHDDHEDVISPDDRALVDRPDLIRRGKAVDALTSTEGLRPA
jgi:hypothetical protein